MGGLSSPASSRTKPSRDRRERSSIEEQKDKYALEWFGSTGSITIAMPNTKRKPFDDPRVTRAMRLLD